MLPLSFNFFETIELSKKTITTMDKEYKRKVRSFKKVPLNKSTKCLFITSKTPIPLDLSSIQSIATFLWIVSAACHMDQTSLKLNEILIENEKRNGLYLNQFAVMFDSEYSATSVKNGLTQENLQKWLNGIGIENMDTRKYVINAVFTSFEEESRIASATAFEFSNPSEVPGLNLINDFITEKEEQEILEQVSSNVVCNSESNNIVTIHFGYEFIDNTKGINAIKASDPFPEWARSIIKRMADNYNIKECDQLTINEYPLEHSTTSLIYSHSLFENDICSLSLNSDIKFTFTNQETKEKKCILAPRRSLLIMSDESRYLWSHETYSMKQDALLNTRLKRNKAISLIFRKLRISTGQAPDKLSSKVEEILSPCKCKWLKYCDSRSSLSTDSLSDKTRMESKFLEDEYVVKFYDKVSVHWDHTRHSPWSAVSNFILYQPEGSLFADIGCGNGKYIKVIKEHKCYYVAVDRSTKLVELCSSKYGYDVAIADAVYLPLRSSQFDAVICIAVLHHISSYERRLKLLKELVRICKSGGKIMVVAWSFEQGEKERRKFEQQDTMVPWHFQHRFEQKEQDNLECDNVSHTDQKETIVQRYCHVYKQGELEELLSHIKDIQILSSDLERGNWNITILKQ
jgi:alkylated DNA repair protein alkB family protein 8